MSVHLERGRTLTVARKLVSVGGSPHTYPFGHLGFSVVGTLVRRTERHAFLRCFGSHSTLGTSEFEPDHSGGSVLLGEPFKLLHVV